MTIAGSFLNLMPYTLIVETNATIDTYGNRTYQSCANYRCAIQGPSKFLFRQTNQERVSTQTIYIGSAASITTQDRVTLPNTFEILQPPILEVIRESNGLGADYTKVLLG